jgi:hypothetical protein
MVAFTKILKKFDKVRWSYLSFSVYMFMYAWKKDKSILYSKKEKKQEEENKFKPILFLFL